MNNFEEFLIWEKTSKDTIDFKKIYVDITGDLIAGLLLSQIIYWYLPDKNGKTKLRSIKDGTMWLAKQHREWWDEVRISEWQAPRALKIMQDAGLIEIKLFKFNGAPTTHIRIIETTFMEAISKVSSGRNSTNRYFESSQMPEWNRAKCQNGIEPNARMESSESLDSLTESTTETTTTINDDAKVNIKVNDEIVYEPIEEPGLDEKHIKSTRIHDSEQFLIDTFCELTGIKYIQPESRRDWAAFQTRWLKPIKGFQKLSGTTERTVSVMEATIKKMRANDWQISCPASIEKTYSAMLGGAVQETYIGKTMAGQLWRRADGTEYIKEEK